MSDQSPQPPDYWAITRRIAEARKTRRATNRQALEAAARRRVPRTPAAQLAEARETRLRAAVDKAVAEALKGLPQMLTELSETAPDAPPLPVVPAKPLHDMTPEEFGTVADQVWSQQGAAMHSPAWQQRRPMTISELIARGYEDDGGA